MTELYSWLFRYGEKYRKCLGWYLVLLKIKKNKKIVMLLEIICLIQYVLDIRLIVDNNLILTSNVPMFYINWFKIYK